MGMNQPHPCSSWWGTGGKLELHQLQLPLPPSWAPRFQAWELFWAGFCGQVEFAPVRWASSQPACWSGSWFPPSFLSICLLGLHWCSLLSFMLHRGMFLAWPLTQRLPPKLCFSKHEKQQGRAKHLWLLGKTWQVVRRRILCASQMEWDRKAVPMLYRTEV